MIHLAILNITTFKGITYDADHFYGKLILSKTFHPITELPNLDLNSLGSSIEIDRLITLKEAKELDKKDNSFFYQNAWQLNNDRRSSRFNSIEDVLFAGIQEWMKILKHSEDVNENPGGFPFTNLYEGKIYDQTILVHQQWNYNV